MTQPVVLAAIHNRIGQITLNRPTGLNALNLDMIRLLRRHLDDWLEDDNVQAVVLRGAGERAFCAGGDIRAVYEQYLAGDEASIVAFFTEEYDLDGLVHGYPKPIIALMDGFVLGGGMGLSQGARLRIITEHSRLGMPETAIGYFPDVGGSYFLPRAPGETGIYLGVTGNHIGPADALYCGLADICIRRDSLAQVEALMAGYDWTSGNAETLLEALCDLPRHDPGPAPLAAQRDAIDRHFRHHSLTEIQQSLIAEQDASSIDWARQTLTTLQQRSPLAMAVTLELLRRGRELDLHQCFALELHLDRQWFGKGDIAEGVRALLVDKDRKPRWNPPQIDQLDPARVADFFAGFVA
ncbi:enoyl-CoA hydratase/isomerase family protein [Pseudomonas sp.]|uniref:enoyl-CoA hydratase/isomerase family protein n=1 Tax=Pseudomonas sp. TaxID=306 RepID=UPI00272BEDE2|nr:enoyl-CoA hydratase/isomerase family protein [Pseudomonas sp.]